MAYDADPRIGDHELATFSPGTYVPTVGGGGSDVVEFISLGLVVPEADGSSSYQIQTAGGTFLYEFTPSYDVARFAPVTFLLHGCRTHKGFRVVISGKACPGNLCYRLVNR